MKYLILALFALSSSFSCGGGGKEDEPVITDPVSSNKLKIIVGSSVFTATLYENATANAFKAMLPLTLAMNELNGNEKFYDLTQSLPSNASNPGTIANGDLMLYGSKTLVLFYKSFSTSYSYTRIGRIADTSKLAEALGAGNVKVTFELE